MTSSECLAELSTELIEELTTAAREHANKVIGKQWQRYAADDRVYYDEKSALAAASFFPNHLRHSKGKLAGKPFHLVDWEDKFIRMIFGFKWKANNLRVIRRVLLFIARKNGKSTLAAGLALLLLIVDGERGAEVYGAAADKEQAAIVFEEAKRMVHASEALSKATEVFNSAIVCTQLSATYQVLSSIASTKHGLNGHGIIFDELHAQENRDLYDVLKTSVGARAQPLQIYMSTAGFDLKTICGEVYDEAFKINAGIFNDLEFLPVIFEADAADDYLDPRSWIKANPNAGEAVSFDYLASEARQAERTPAAQNTFRRLHLNQWTAQETRWLDMAAWNASAGPMDWRELEEVLEGRDCFGGIDLSSTQDVSARLLVFPPDEPDGAWALLGKFYLPRDRIQARVERDRVPYDQWVREGSMIATDGNIIDYSFIKADILADRARYNIKEIAYDRWNATQLVVELQDEGLNMVQFAQSLMAMNAPTKFFEGLVIDKRLRHGGHPVMNWMVGNVAVQSDGEGNIKPSKRKSREKIDGVVAAIMGIGRATAGDTEKPAMPGIAFIGGGAWA